MVTIPIENDSRNTAERSLLGALLIEPDLLGAVQEIITPDVFRSEANRLVYTSICALDARMTPVDLISVCEHLRAHRNLEAAGGAAGVASLTNQSPTSPNAVWLARAIAGGA